MFELDNIEVTILVDSSAATTTILFPSSRKYSKEHTRFSALISKGVYPISNGEEFIDDKLTYFKTDVQIIIIIIIIIIN